MGNTAICDGAIDDGVTAVDVRVLVLLALMGLEVRLPEARCDLLVMSHDSQSVGHFV